jgi:Leucine-rich repeat (LRR) protein
VNLKHLNLAYNQLGLSLPLGGWANLQNLESIELQNNRLTGLIPADMKTLKSLRYVNLSKNNMTGNIPIFLAAQKIEGIDLNNNQFQRWPEEYFATDSFRHLEFINVNFNPLIVIPEVCRRTAICFKKTVLESKDANLIPAVEDSMDDLIMRSIDTFSYANVQL